jgi:hypothetical protein
MRHLLLSAVCLIPLACAGASAQDERPVGAVLRMPPSDEASTLPAFSAFISRFRRAVSNRDAREILAMTSDQIAATESTRGRTAFRKEWMLDSNSARFWRLAESALSGGFVAGCQGDECAVSAPSWFFKWSTTQLDIYDHAVVRRDDVPMFAEPKASARVIATLSFDVVEDLDRSLFDRREFIHVKLVDGRTGYIRDEDLYDVLIGPKMIFGRKGQGPWLLVSFNEGDL